MSKTKEAVIEMANQDVNFGNAPIAGDGGGLGPLSVPMDREIEGSVGCDDLPNDPLGEPEEAAF